MAPLHLGALIALAVAGAGGEPERLATSYLPPALVSEALDQALPPPPDRVYLETRTYGTVMVDHKAHLARRVGCRTCHGSGTVGSIAFTPRSAHDSCRACHVDLKRGPTSCRDCHVQSAEPPVAHPGENARFVFRAPDGKRIADTKSSRTPKPAPVVAKVAPVAKPALPPPPPAQLLAEAEQAAAERDDAYL